MKDQLCSSYSETSVSSNYKRGATHVTTHIQKQHVDGIISEPSFREYIFYSDCKDLTSPDRILPSRQYTLVKDNEIRIMYTQTTDALYN